jgi:hypothetical protein
MTSSLPLSPGDLPTPRVHVKWDHGLPEWIRLELKRYRLFRLIGNTCAALSFVGVCVIATLSLLEFPAMLPEDPTAIIVVAIISLIMFIVACVLGPQRAKLRPMYVRHMS